MSAGDTIAGKYRLHEVLGKGATGIVWRATQLGLDRPVAIKLLHPQIAERQDAAVRFEREARVAASLDHPSSVAVLDFGSDDSTLYLVMELLSGESLRERFKRGALPLGEAVGIAREIAMALGAAHRIRLVHRDIKPENVILPAGQPRPPAKVVDFGLAFIVEADEPTRMGRVTADGSVAGTPAYMSPEQVRGGSIGPPSDVYALGCVLYEMIAGRPPFVGAVGEIMTRHAYAPPISLRQLELPESVPPALDELVLAMMSKSPSSRPTANRVVSLLAPFEQKDEQRIGRTSAPIIERYQRAVPRASPDQPTDELSAGDAAITIGVVGEAMPEDTELALRASGIRPERWREGAIGSERIVWAPAASAEQLAALVEKGKRVVTDVESGSAGNLPALIRAGVSDVIVRPHDVDDLVRRLWRTHRLAGRS